MIRSILQFVSILLDYLFNPVFATFDRLLKILNYYRPTSSSTNSFKGKHHLLLYIQSKLFKKELDFQLTNIWVNGK